MPLDMEDPEVKSEVEKLINSAVSAAADPLKESISKLEGKNSELLGEKQKLADRYKDIDVDRYSQLMKHFEDNEEAKLIAEGKFDELIQIRTEKFRQQNEEKFADFETKLNEAEKQRDAANSKLNSYAIEVQLRKEAEKAGVLPQAIDDLILFGSGKFKLNESMEAFYIDSDGDIVTNEKGQPINASGFINDLKETKAHWWPSSQGGDLGGAFDAFSPEMASKLQDALARGDHATYRKLRKEGKAA